ncbi:helix-turn-helix transcriptional regulator [Nocardia sp. SYP-A9097]|uniref:helix-turn-helix domain-containing protein n=1 Tax=Nocardia sp. SYP-A9097 TaxID=2663237 RepID=UPI00129BCFD9|nr:helix-turn-helix transcriptional regulator [Nocardia sp. SYP-A9097]
MLNTRKTARKRTIQSNRRRIHTKTKPLPAILGASIGRLRTASGVPRKRAARALHLDVSMISRLEAGQTTFNDEYLDTLLRLYGVDPCEQSRYRAWAGRIRTDAAWWPDTRHNESSGLDELLDLEPPALIRSYDLAVVPELLQTPDYARELLRLEHEELAADRVDRLLEARLTRGRILSGERPPVVWLIVEAAALRRRIGEYMVWRRQIHHLLSTLEMPNVRVQILEDYEHGPVLAHHAFAYLRFADPSLSDLVRVRQLTGTMCLADTERYLQLADELAIMANPPQCTADRLRELLH